MKSHLTKRSIEALSTTGKRYAVWDEQIRGLGVRVNVDGSKSFVVKYFINGRQRWLTLARFGVMTLDEARKQALGVLGDRAKGEDAVEKKRRARAEATAKSLSLREFCDLYMEDAHAGKVTYRGRPKKASTLAVDEGRIHRHIVPTLGKKRIGDVTTEDVTHFLHAVRLGKTATTEKTGPRGLARVRGGDTAANRAVGLLGSVMTYAVKQGLRNDNPVRGIERPPDRRRERVLSPDQYFRFGEALDTLLEKGANPFAVFASRLLALTGCRRSEIFGLKKSEVDDHHRCFRFGDTKSGQQARPIGSAAFAVLSKVPQLENSEFVFPGARGGGHLLDIKVLKEACRSAGLDGMTAHGFRHAFASVAGELNYSDAVIGVMLGHRMSSVTSRYTHIPDPAAVAAADCVSNTIARRMRGEGDNAKVVQFRQA